MAKRNHGARPAVPASVLRQSDVPPNYDNETPKFCLHHLRDGFDAHSLDLEKRAAFACTLQRLACMQWKQIMTAPRHGLGAEFLPAEKFYAPIPARFADTKKFLVLRYHGKLPMAGARVQDVFHILWIEPAFNKLYDHGS